MTKSGATRADEAQALSFFGLGRAYYRIARQPRLARCRSGTRSVALLEWARRPSHTRISCEPALPVVRSGTCPAPHRPSWPQRLIVHIFDPPLTMSGERRRRRRSQVARTTLTGTCNSLSAEMPGPSSVAADAERGLAACHAPTAAILSRRNCTSEAMRPLTRSHSQYGTTTTR